MSREKRDEYRGSRVGCRGGGNRNFPHWFSAPCPLLFPRHSTLFPRFPSTLGTTQRKIPRGRRSTILGEEGFGEEVCLPGVAMLSRCRDFPEREKHERYPLDEARLRGNPWKLGNSLGWLHSTVSVGHPYHVDAEVTVFRCRPTGARTGGNVWSHCPGRSSGFQRHSVIRPHRRTFGSVPAHPWYSRLRDNKYTQRTSVGHRLWRSDIGLRSQRHS